MKKVITEFVKQFGCTTTYSGNKKTMYIHGEQADAAEVAVIKEFGYNLPFKIS